MEHQNIIADSQFYGTLLKSIDSTQFSDLSSTILKGIENVGLNHEILLGLLIKQYGLLRDRESLLKLEEIFSKEKVNYFDRILKYKNEIFSKGWLNYNDLIFMYHWPIDSREQ